MRGNSAAKTRAALTGTNLRGQTPICNFLRVPEVFCGFLRESAFLLRKSAFPKQQKSARISVWARFLALGLSPYQQVLNPTPLNPTPATCHKRKRKLRCSFRSAALQKLHCNIGFSAVRKSFGPKAALQQTKSCTATSKKLRCRKVALSCRFPAAFKPPRLGTHVRFGPADLKRALKNRLTEIVASRHLNALWDPKNPAVLKTLRR